MASPKCQPKNSFRPKRKLGEAAIVRKLLAELSAAGVYAWRQNTGAVKILTRRADVIETTSRMVRFGLPGQSDITGIIKGGTRLEIECKTDTGELSDLQKQFRNLIQSSGGLWLLCQGAGDIERVLNEVRVCAARRSR